MSSTGAREGRTNLFTTIQGKINQIRYSPADIERKTRLIYDTVVRESRRMKVGNFTSIENEDLDRLYRLYDREFFSSVLNALIKDVHKTELTFRLSPRMTSAGGKTTRTRRTIPGPGGVVTKTDYEIAISTLLLFQTFQDPSKPAIVCGLECRDRLDALLRIFEHEAIHLLEMLVWGDSSCSAANFQSLAYRIFGHKGVVHELITPRDRAHAEFAIVVGDLVRFEHEGRSYRGVVNRITRRASVLVPSPEGIDYSDGRKYLRFYVPLESLEKVGRA